MSPHHRIRGILAVGALLLVPVYAQNSTGASSTGAGTTPASTGPTIPSPGTLNSATTGQSRTPPAPIRVSGRVVVDDGSPLSSPAIIERVCNGNTQAEGYTDNSGYFYLTLGRNAEMVPDASQEVLGGSPVRNTSQSPTTTGNGSATTSTGGGRSPVGDDRYANCELRARLGGYTSQSLNLVNHGPLDDPNVGNILLHRAGESQKGSTVTASSLKAPKEARKALEKGLSLARRNKTGEAIESLQQAVTLDPGFADAWCQLGRLQKQEGRNTEAYAAFEAAAKAEPRWPDPLLGLAMIDVEDEHWQQAADHSDGVLRLNSFQYSEAYFFNAAANYNLHHMQVAESAARSAEKLDTQHRHPQIQHLLGIILSDRHQYAEAAEKLRLFLSLAPNASDAPSARQRLAELDRLIAEPGQVAGKDR